MATTFTNPVVKSYKVRYVSVNRLDSAIASALAKLPKEDSKKLSAIFADVVKSALESQFEAESEFLTRNPVTEHLNKDGTKARTASIRVGEFNQGRYALINQTNALLIARSPNAIVSFAFDGIPPMTIDRHEVETDQYSGDLPDDSVL